MPDPTSCLSAIWQKKDTLYTTYKCMKTVAKTGTSASITKVGSCSILRYSNGLHLNIAGKIWVTFLWQHLLLFFVRSPVFPIVITFLQPKQASISIEINMVSLSLSPSPSYNIYIYTYYIKMSHAMYIHNLSLCIYIIHMYTNHPSIILLVHLPWHRAATWQNF